MAPRCVTRTSRGRGRQSTCAPSRGWARAGRWRQRLREAPFPSHGPRQGAEAPRLQDAGLAAAAVCRRPACRRRPAAVATAPSRCLSTHAARGLPPTLPTVSPGVRRIGSRRPRHPSSSRLTVSAPSGRPCAANNRRRAAAPPPPPVPPSVLASVLLLQPHHLDPLPARACQESGSTASRTAPPAASCATPPRPPAQPQTRHLPSSAPAALPAVATMPTSSSWTTCAATRASLGCRGCARWVCSLEAGGSGSGDGSKHCLTIATGSDDAGVTSRHRFYVTLQSSPGRGVYSHKLGGSEGVANCLVWPTSAAQQGTAWYSDGEEEEEQGSRRSKHGLVLSLGGMPVRGEEAGQGPVVRPLRPPLLLLPPRATALLHWPPGPACRRAPAARRPPPLPPLWTCGAWWVVYSWRHSNQSINYI